MGNVCLACCTDMCCTSGRWSSQGAVESDLGDVAVTPMFFFCNGCLQFRKLFEIDNLPTTLPRFSLFVLYLCMFLFTVFVPGYMCECLFRRTVTHRPPYFLAHSPHAPPTYAAL